MPEQNPAIQLDAEEQQLLSTYAAGAWRSVATPGVIQTLREAARATGQKDQRINIRLSAAISRQSARGPCRRVSPIKLDQQLVAQIRERQPPRATNHQVSRLDPPALVAKKKLWVA